MGKGSTKAPTHPRAAPDPYGWLGVIEFQPRSDPALAARIADVWFVWVVLVFAEPGEQFFWLGCAFDFNELSSQGWVLLLCDFEESGEGLEEGWFFLVGHDHLQEDGDNLLFCFRRWGLPQGLKLSDELYHAVLEAECAMGLRA